MVSSKCFQVESPSPFKFLAALMPPCAQTECDRFTGTMEKRSTGVPDSATRIAAISPARPPTTIMILGVLIRAVSLDVRPEREPVIVKSKGNRDAHESQNHGNGGSQPRSCALRARSYRNAPLAGEIPQAISQMKGRRGNADKVKRQVPGIRHCLRHVVIVGSPMANKPLRVHVPADKDERDNSAPALENIHPVGHPGMAQRVRLPGPPDVNAVEAVEKYRNPQNAGLHKDAPRNALQLGGNVVVFLHAHQSVAIRPEMLEEECSNRNHAAQRMQFVEEVTCFGFSRCGRHACSEVEKSV